ncbi:MAG: cytochrome P450, partial [Gammaproteobacteria bacterium]
MGKLETIDWDSEAHLREPHAAYAIGRQESPVYRVPGKDLVMVFGYDAVIEALMKPLVFSSRNEQALLGTSIHNPRCREIYARGWPQVETLLTNDPPSHTRFKKLVNRAFTREKVDGLEGQITGIVDRLIDAFAAAGHCEFVRDFAIPLPCTVIARQLGIDTADVP